jgi:hypothetical protein
LVFGPDGRRISPDLESGEAILICEILALILAHNLQLEKCYTGPFSAPNRKTRPDQLQLAGPPSEKSQKIVILTTQNSSFGGAFFRDAEVPSQQLDSREAFKYRPRHLESYGHE